ncbi:hypothetical protein Btru_056207 [Bulinus truncatus]|nr:hypothetical protein Btru_056207 [Bulinus truncatus]
MEPNATQATSNMADELFTVVYTVNIVYLVTFLSLFGLIANAVNICVFVKQGFRDKVNMSLLALAISDAGTLLTVLPFSVCSNPLLVSSGLPVAFEDVQSVLGAFPRGTFCRVTNCITTYITMERCLCVVFPIKVKRIITKKVTAATLILIYLTLVLIMIPPYFQVNLGWRFDPYLNRTVVGAILTDYRGVDINGILSFHTCIQLVSFVLITLFTSILRYELKKQSKWRQVSTLTNDGSAKNAKKKAGKTIRMITIMATIYIACYSLSIVHLIYNVVEPSYSLYGASRNNFWMILSTTFVLESLNASVGIFLYLKMSGKYRATFLRMFFHCSNAELNRSSSHVTSRTKLNGKLSNRLPMRLDSAHLTESQKVDDLMDFLTRFQQTKREYLPPSTQWTSAVMETNKCLTSLPFQPISWEPVDLLID